MDELTQCDYGSALIPNDVTICGVTLKPFCIGHLMILDELQNPYLGYDAIMVDERVAHYRLYEAILVCGMTYEKGLELVRNKKKWKEEYAKFDKNLMRNIIHSPKWNFFEKKNAFNGYLTYYLQSMPSYTIVQQNENALNSGTDWKTAIAVIFKKMNHTESEFLNMNTRLLFVKWTADAEAEGTIKVFDKNTAQRDKEFQLNKQIEKITLANE
jgi:hypothetical protein